jgi:hypothetical protein
MHHLLPPELLPEDGAHDGVGCLRRVMEEIRYRRVSSVMLRSSVVQVAICNAGNAVFITTSLSARTPARATQVPPRHPQRHRQFERSTNPNSRRRPSPRAISHPHRPAPRLLRIGHLGREVEVGAQVVSDDGSTQVARDVEEVVLVYEHRESARGCMC